MTSDAARFSFSPDLSLPISAVTQKFAFLGISGSGKTYGAGKLVEGLLDVGAQVVVIDTVGNWYGLRLAADGKRPGISIPVLGGERGDVALDSTAGKLAAETVAESKASMILDVSDFTASELRRFVTDFATALLALKKRSKSPVMVVWEECQDIVPQRVFGEDAKMVGAVEKLIKKGRNYGIGSTLISQRAAAVNKDVLNQIATLFAFRAVATQDRKAIRDWVVDHARDVAALVDELPSLPTGTCYCWSPQWLQVLSKVRVGKKRTFDASATPDLNDEIVTAGALAPVDLERFKKRMGEAIERARASDPSVLRKRVAELEAQIAKRLPPVVTETKTKVIERSVLREADAKRLEKTIDRADALFIRVEQMSEVIRGDLKTVNGALKAAVAPQPQPATPRPAPAPHAPKSAPPQRDRKPLPDGDTGMGKGERAILSAIIQHRGCTHGQLAVLTGYTKSSRNTYLQKLRQRGYIAETRDGHEATAEGIAAIPDVEDLPTGAELREHWLKELPKGERAVFEVVIANYPQPVTREAIDDRTGYTKSSRNTYLQKLSARQLITNERDGVRASDTLFGVA